MTEREQIMHEMMKHFQQEKEMKRARYRQQNAYIRKGETLFTGSSLMEQFPITEYCLNEGLPIASNRGIGGYTTAEFLAADIRAMPEGEDWFTHLSANYRAICEIIRDKLPKAAVYMMAYYPVNLDALQARAGQGPIVRTNENVVKANEMVRALAAEFGFHYIDVNDGLKDETGSLKAEYTRDGIHFDSAAYRTVFDRLKQYL